MLTDLFLILIIKLDAKSVKNLAETNNLEDTIVDGRVILKWMWMYRGVELIRIAQDTVHCPVPVKNEKNFGFH